MVAECQRKFPNVTFGQGDARNMPEFPDKMIYLVMFSMNGISMVDHQGRLEILQEVYRVLEPGGVFLFSTYNKDNSDYKKLLQLPKFRATNNPFRFGARCIKYGATLLLMVRNRCRFKRHEQHTKEYSIVNDRCHLYATMLYYIGQDSQREQLMSVGFESKMLAFDLKGDEVGDDGVFDNSIFYIARKPS
jgi:SAM-dependent methyltransferase